MATNIATSPPSVSLEQIPYTVSEVIYDGEHSGGPHAELDDRSSSLSELGERAGHEEAGNVSRSDSDANDTEAETERLEDSPKKPRIPHNVTLASANGIHGDRESSALRTMTGNNRDNDPLSDNDRFGQTSDISSLADSGDEINKISSTIPSSSRKRKRASFGDKSLSDGQPTDIASPKLFSKVNSSIEENLTPNGSTEEEEQEAIVGTDVFRNTDTQPRKAQQYASTKQTYKKGKRKGRKPCGDDDNEGTADETAGVRRPAELGEMRQLAYGNEEDMEVDDAGEGPEADQQVKTEEGGVQRKTAFDSLHALEKCFATLRDKIFDERLSQCNEELVLLEQSVSTHPEFLAMKEAIDQRRDQKIDYEHVLMKNKLTTLQRESVANKAQINSQYMQDVREIRDSALDRLNREYYQLQKERRSCEGDVPEYMYKFTTKRSRQITQQMAYNSEVSILSGVARHVGFPAAPEISKARPNEIEDDLRHMGIALGASHTSQPHRPALRATLSGPAGFPRQRPAAEEHFLEQNAWANPQHPSHLQQRQQIHRQVSALSRATTPASTPAAQRRTVDLTELQGSASTIAEPHSGPSSSMAPTPATGEASRVPQSDQYRRLGDKLVHSTPSKVLGGFIEATLGNSTVSGLAIDKGKGPQPDKPEPSQSPSSQRNKSQEAQTPNLIPKPLPFMHTGGSSTTLGVRSSTPVRYPAVKAEEASQHQRRSPMPHQYHAPATVTAVASGQSRFAA